MKYINDFYKKITEFVYRQPIVIQLIILSLSGFILVGFVVDFVLDLYFASVHQLHLLVIPIVINIDRILLPLQIMIKILCTFYILYKIYYYLEKIHDYFYKK